MRLIILQSLFLFLNIYTSDASSNSIPKDRYLIAKNFNDVEDLFLMNGCRFFFLTSYQYFPATERFTNKDLSKKYPNNNEIIAMDGDICDGIVPLSIFNQTFNTSFTADTPAFLLYFDAVHIAKTGEYFIHKQFVPRAKRRLDMALSFSQDSLYIVKTPDTGWKP